MNLFLEKYFKNILLIVSCISFYAYIFWSINRGISSDEGWYLVGYLNPVGQSGASDYHHIIRTIFSFLNFESALQQRYFYFFLNILIVTLFAFTAFSFFQKKLGLKENKLSFILLVLIVNVFNFTFASPLLYYDTLQYLLFLLIFIFLFQAELNVQIKSICYFFVGFLSLYVITNYISSGILFLFLIVVWAILRKQFSLKNVLIVFFGFITSCLLYHLCIHSLSDFVEYSYNTIIKAQSVESDSLTLPGHGIGDLLGEFFSYFFKTLLTLGGLFVVSVLSFALIKKKTSGVLSNILQILFYFIIFIFSFVFRLYLGTTMFLFPIVFLIADLFAGNRVNEGKTKTSIGVTTILLFLCFLTIPIIGVFGTNQPLERKTMLFLVFWLFAYYILQSNFAIKLSKFNQRYLSTSFMVFALISFLFYGFFTRYHNYYGIRKADYYLSGTPYLKDIKLVEYQRDHIEKVNTIMKDNGFQKGDRMIAFEVDLMVAFAVGGSFSERLPYTHNQMQESNFIPSEKIDYILIYKRAEEEFSHYLGNKTNWGFPENYKRIELGRFATNMQDEYSSVLYVAQPIGEE